jgi:hypothetical protein
VGGKHSYRRQVECSALLIFNAEAVVVRNVAGHVAPNLLDAVALDVAVGGLKEVMVIHHTGEAYLRGLSSIIGRIHLPNYQG